MAPTLVAPRTSLPPEGARFALGRPCGKTEAPVLVASRTSLPPEGARFALRRPYGETTASALGAFELVRSELVEGCHPMGSLRLRPGPSSRSAHARAVSVAPTGKDRFLTRLALLDGETSS